jgi:BioD-like phosphotransacetylase family protein
LGWRIATEHKVSDELVLDIHAQRKDSVLAVLIETGKSHVKENIAKTIAAGYLDVCVISENPGVARIVSQAQETFPNARIKIKTPRRALE